MSTARHCARCLPLGIVLAFSLAAAPAASSPETSREEAGCSAPLQTAAVDDSEAAMEARPRRLKPVPKAQKRGPTPEPAKKVATAKAAQAAAAKFYRYPMMYRGEAPPRMPPGVEQHLAGNAQPYVQAGPGVWYWPGADSIKIPRVPGFDPQIEASKVIQW
jgi:hypothetical protein